jgi:hypothetical protein
MLVEKQKIPDEEIAVRVIARFQFERGLHNYISEVNDLWRIVYTQETKILCNDLNQSPIRLFQPKS